MAQEYSYDVLVVGTGNAAMSATLAARENSVQIGILDKAPKDDRGGNSYLTGAMRFAFNSVEDLIPLINDPTPSDIQGMADAMPHRTPAELYDQLMEANHGKSDPNLLNIHVSESLNTIKWVRSQGHDFVPAYTGAVNGGNVIGINGGTAGLLEHYYKLLEADNIPFHYGTSAQELIVDNGRVVGVKAITSQGDVIFHAKAVILACGGFEANAEMRGRYLGRPWDTMKIRGVPFNTGEGLTMSLAVGAVPYGAWANAHCSPCDMNMPDFTLPSARRTGALGASTRYSYPYSIMVNVNGKRFVNEGWHTRGYTYGQMGQHILRQPEGVAFQLFDAKARRMNLIAYDPTTATGTTANTLEDLADQLGIDPKGMVQTVKEFNAAIQDGTLNPGPFRMDGKHTDGLEFNKTNYSISIEEPPFEGYAVTGGMTFTWGGLKVDQNTAQVEHVGGWSIPGLYAAGELMGGLWMYGYGSGSGIMAGATWGRRAGYAASKAALGE
jgi:tricarballylate dehydrogenase